jgi:hypothetical protein
MADGGRSGAPYGAVFSSIRREEPASALFAVPSDYTVKDVMANVTRILEKKAQ